MKEDTFYVFTQFQSPLRGAHYLLRESFTNIEKFSEKRILMEPDVNVHYAYCWIYMVTELIDTLSVKFFKIVVAKLKQPKRQIRVSRAYFPAILRYIERNEFIFFVIY